MANGKNSKSLDWDAILSGIPHGKTFLEFGAERNIYWQGDSADSIYYIQQGKVKLAVTSKQGKEAIVSILGSNEFFGEGCLAGQLLRMATASAITDCSLVKIMKAAMTNILHEQRDFAEIFAMHLLTRNIRYESDLVDQLFNSSEKRLARMLLLLSHFGKESRSEAILPSVSQENLAQMVGTTRSRISHFMNKFRTMGLIEYNDRGVVKVHSGLLTVVLNDDMELHGAKEAF